MRKTSFDDAQRKTCLKFFKIMLALPYSEECPERCCRGWVVVTWNCHSVLQAWTPGVTWSVTWCYLECYLVLPGVSPGVTWALPGYLAFFMFFLGPKITAFLKLKLFEKK